MNEQCGFRFFDELTLGVLPMKKLNGEGLLVTNAKEHV
tara:strand:- start:28 stop:141 length:114 start_codon:yes stop_codon:yes gene_type:complete